MWLSGCSCRELEALERQRSLWKQILLAAVTNAQTHPTKQGRSLKRTEHLGKRERLSSSDSVVIELGFNRGGEDSMETGTRSLGEEKPEFSSGQDSIHARRKFKRDMERSPARVPAIPSGPGQGRGEEDP